MNADKASSAESVTQRVDVHHHLASPGWLQAMKLIGAEDPVIANWSVQKSLVRRRHDAQHHQPYFQRHLAEIPGHQLDLLARRRADLLCRTPPGADGCDSALSGPIHP